MKYIYPATFTKEKDGGFSVSFPDLKGAHTCGDNLEEALFMAQDCLGFILYGMEEDKEKFPSASKIAGYKNSDEKFTNLISIDLSEYKKRVDDKPIRKTLYIPKYLNDKAEAAGVNFSALLRQTLEKKLG